jgi:ketosteroid isomerase-like protein
MLPARSCFVAAALFLTAGVAGQEAIPPALQAMADTEREFASAAKVKGVRDAFLEFFADDAISFGPTPIPAKERLLKRPSQPFSVEELVWEPRTGDVAASGELGWLTGPSTFINHGAQDKTPRYGNYLSVWRRYADGRWRVFIDVGVAAKQPVTFTPGFTRIPFGQRYAGKDGKQAAGESLQAADRELDTRIGSEGASRARMQAICRPDRVCTAAASDQSSVRTQSSNGSAATCLQCRPHLELRKQPAREIWATATGPTN